MTKKYTDIKELEFTYHTHFSVSIDDLENADLFREGKVKQFWVKYGTLYIETTDGEEVSEYLSDSSDMFDNVDPKWPESTSIHTEEGWVRKELYNTMYEEEE